MSFSQAGGLRSGVPSERGRKTYRRPVPEESKKPLQGMLPIRRGQISKRGEILQKKYDTGREKNWNKKSTERSSSAQLRKQYDRERSLSVERERQKVNRVRNVKQWILDGDEEEYGQWFHDNRTPKVWSKAITSPRRVSRNRVISNASDRSVSPAASSIQRARRRPVANDLPASVFKYSPSSFEVLAFRKQLPIPPRDLSVVSDR